MTPGVAHYQVNSELWPKEEEKGESEKEEGQIK